jgi:hypothetical protein
MSKVIEIILPDDNPNGMKIIQLANSTGKAFVVPRGKLKDIKDRSESNDPAVYFLFGEGEDPTRKIAYIGESERFYKRLTDHDSSKDYWNIAVVFTGGLDRADVKYLENKSVNLSKQIDRYGVQNKTEPLENKLSEAKKIVADEAFERIKLILSFLGFTLFQEISGLAESFEIYTFKTDKALATGRLLDTGEFIVFAGSTARIKETEAFRGSGPALRRRLVDEGVLAPINEESYKFTKDYIFTSPSAAADTIAGRSSNGWTAWKDKNGKTLDENKRK